MAESLSEVGKVAQDIASHVPQGTVEHTSRFKEKF
jgi:hypothetical protein